MLASRGDMLDAVHTKAHTLLSWRMMAVSTRNFINVSLRSEALGVSAARSALPRALVHKLRGLTAAAPWRRRS
eukprot:2136324-Prymnesium_polylepis.1